MLRFGMEIFMIHGNDITFSYSINTKDPPIINHVDFNVDAGEFIAILGANGSGKSTFCKLLNGLLLPQSGKLTVADIDVHNTDKLWELRRKIGMVFQNPDNQFVSSVVAQDIAFGLENYEFSREEIDKKITQSLEMVNMQGFENACPHNLSGGQKQRIAIAGILALHPDIIVFDEATSMLDPIGRKEVLDIIQQQKAFGKTIIMVTHYIEEAVFADKIYLMHQGTFSAYGTPFDILTNSERLIQSGMLPLTVVKLYEDLKKMGICLEHCPITIAEFVEELCQLRQKM